MRLRFTDHQPIYDRSALKPKSGDLVNYEGKEYIVTRVGSRWLYMYEKDQADNPRRAEYMAPVTRVIKVFPNVNVPETEKMDEGR